MMGYGHLIEKALKCGELQREVAALTKEREALREQVKGLVEALEAIGNRNFLADRAWAIRRANEALAKYGGK